MNKRTYYIIHLSDVMALPPRASHSLWHGAR